MSIKLLELYPLHTIPVVPLHPSPGHPGAPLGPGSSPLAQFLSSRSFRPGRVVVEKFSIFIYQLVLNN